MRDWIRLKRRPGVDLPTIQDDMRGQIRNVSGDDATTTDQLWYARNRGGTDEWVLLRTIPAVAGEPFIRPGFQAGDAASVTTPTSNRTLAHYLGVAPRNLSSVTLRFTVTTAAATITWAEVGLATSDAFTLGASTMELTTAGFTNVATSFNSTGDKAVTVSADIPAGSHVWVLHGSQATTPFVLRGGLADAVSAGFTQFRNSTRPSTMSDDTAFAIATGSIHAAWIAAQW